MNICIVGWYGTETLGDRAILAGLFDIFQATFGHFDVNIGSLYPFLSQRTLFEDAAIYDVIAPQVTVNIFDVKNKNDLDTAIAKTDFIVMGGGPIMDLFELEIISYVFRQARKKSKKTAVLGCGIGPLYKQQYIDIACSIFENSDLIILRDMNSLNRLASLAADKKSTILNKALFAHDPAILPVGKYLVHGKPEMQHTVAVNFRKFPAVCFQSGVQITDQLLAHLLNRLATVYGEVNLVPMHTFYVGGDDRHYLTEIKMMTSAQNIRVIHKPMNLYELFDQYASSQACIGMRYHSVVFQSLLNGNNYIIDYTEKITGKINSFLEILDLSSFYNGRYINIQEVSVSRLDFIDSIISALTTSKASFEFDTKIFEHTANIYKTEILHKCFHG